MSQQDTPEGLIWSADASLQAFQEYVSTKIDYRHCRIAQALLLCSQLVPDYFCTMMQWHHKVLQQVLGN